MKEKLKIYYRNVDEIRPYSKNPRKNEKAVEIVAKSIKEFGFQNPIILDGKQEIIAGHTRLKAAKQLKMKEVPVIYAEDLTEEQVKAFRIMDNKSAELAEWDFELLKGELYSLEGTESFELTGFSSNEISKIWDKQVEDDGFVEVSAYERAKSKTKVKQGEIYILGEHKLMCGDSTKKEDVARLMGENKAILMVTDPPYGVNYDPKWRDEADKKGLLGNRYPTRAMGEVQNDDRIDWSDAYSLFDGDIMYVWHAGKYASEVAESIKKVDFELINQIVWVKPHFILSRGDYHWKHEPCWYAVRKGKNHNYKGDRSQTTVWEIGGMNCFGGSKDKADERTGHGTQKPLLCMSTPIKNNSLSGDNIYDPFGGSGTTLIACEQLDRKCFMMELDPVYCQVIIDRWEKLTSKTAVKI